MLNPKNIPLNSFVTLMAQGMGANGTGAFPLDALLKAGNHKLPRTTAIFNMGSAHDCPAHKLGFCQAYVNGKHVCYALKAERTMTPEVLPYRKRQEAFWKSVTAEQFAWQFLAINALKNNNFSKLRLNESGDFWTQECVDKAETIARYLSRYGIKVYCYTSRSDLDFSKVKYLVVSGSGFRKIGITSEFRMITHLEQKPKGWNLCRGNCRVCEICQKRNQMTAILRH